MTFLNLCDMSIEPLKKDGMKRQKQLILLLLTLLLFNCSKDNTPEPVKVMEVISPPEETTLSSAKELIEFSVTSANNPDLRIDGDVQQTGTSLKLFFPFGMDLSQLKVSYQVSDKAKLKADGNEVGNNSTALDFSSPVTLTVEAEDGSTKDYSLTAEANFANIDSAIQELMETNNAPSMQLAITKGEKLVYQAHYGTADLSNTEQVTDESVYRIASVSKVVTAIAILKMKDDGLLDFDDTVFGGNGILGTDFGNPPYKTNIENITVRHLLDHTSGFTNNPNDPFFVNYDWSLQELIDDVIDNRNLATVPGQTYYYSNFGYCMLGRIIEKLSGMTYENYVKQKILAPLGIQEMNIGKNGMENKLPNEVEYTVQEAFSAYAYNIERIDALGGWTASATDLTKFLIGIDRQAGVSDIVSPAAMTGSYFMFDEWVFFGSLPGTSAVVGRLNEEFNYSIVTNTRLIPITLNQKMYETMKAEILARSSWPNYNLFELD